MPKSSGGGSAVKKLGVLCFVIATCMLLMKQQGFVSQKENGHLERREQTAVVAPQSSVSPNVGSSMSGVQESPQEQEGSAVARRPKKELFRCVNSTASLDKFRGSGPKGEADTRCCAGVKNDIDHGLSLFHFLSRAYCLMDGKALFATANMPHRMFRIVQIGANSGDNANDHLVKFLKMNVAEAALLEPVPWLFEVLEKTYTDYRENVQLINAAMSKQAGGNVTFTAPKKGARGWTNQMGGLSLPPKSQRTVHKKHLRNMFETIQVPSVNVKALLERLHWATLPDAVVIDTEGFDAHIVNMFLDEQQVRPRGEKPMSIIQYEWKHIEEKVRQELIARLNEAGYCVTQVHYDDIAIHVDSYGASLPCADSFLP